MCGTDSSWRGAKRAFRTRRGAYPSPSFFCFADLSRGYQPLGLTPCGSDSLTTAPRFSRRSGGLFAPPLEPQLNSPRPIGY